MATGRGHQLVVAVDRDGQHEPETERLDDLGAQVLGERAGRCAARRSSAMTHAADVRWNCEPRAGFVGQPPPRHRLQPFGAVEHLRVAERREREAGGVREHLLDRDDLLAVGGELRDDVGDPLVESEQTVAEQLPHHAGDDGPPDRLQDVARLVGCVAVGLEGDEASAGSRRRPVPTASGPWSTSSRARRRKVKQAVEPTGGVDVSGARIIVSARSGARRVQTVWTLRATISSGIPDSEAQKNTVSTGASPTCARMRAATSSGVP